MLYWTPLEYEADRGNDWMTEHDTARATGPCANCGDTVYWRVCSPGSTDGRLCAPCADALDGES